MSQQPTTLISAKDIEKRNQHFNKISINVASTDQFLYTNKEDFRLYAKIGLILNKSIEQKAATPVDE